MFMGWVHGAGTPVGVIGEMLAAGFNANCGGRDHIGLEVERQITRWMAEVFGFPAGASGVFVTGTSMANFLALLVARQHAMGDAARADGLRAASAQLVAYTSVQAHGCVVQAVELAGIGSAYLRRIGVDGSGAMRLEPLAAAIRKDRAAGRLPFMVVGTAGTVNTGAMDDLAGIAGIAEDERVWFHVDGAFGAMAQLAPSLRHRLNGIERANSIAFDFHKWMHVPYDAGFLLVRDGDTHKRAFSSPAAYLQRLPRGLAAGDSWPCDLGPDLSRGFRALKTWMTLETIGVDRFGAAIEHCCELAKYLERRLRELQQFELAAPVGLNIVCWRLSDFTRDADNAAIVMDLHERGIAVPSMTTLDRRPAIRASIVNHRTTHHHIDALIDALVDSEARICGAG
jgi:glutamate/tyrosine decarboxylase-like PLP-dependent enzyme